MRSVLRLCAVSGAGFLLASAWSCAPAIKPLPAPAPAPVTPPVIVAPPVISSWTLPPTVPPTRYAVNVIAQLERDSVGRVLREQVESRAVVMLQLRRDSTGGLRGSGQVDSFTVRGLERALASDDGRGGGITPLTPAAPLSVAFDAVLEVNAIRVTAKPPLVNECDRPESGAASLVRDVLVRLPRTLQVGKEWRDSTVGFQCRVGVPITSHTRSRYVVERADNVDGVTELLVRRTTEILLNGELKTAWRVVTITGSGRGSHAIRVDAGSGVVRGIDGEGSLTVRLTDSARRDASGVQEVRQSTRSRVVVVR